MSNNQKVQIRLEAFYPKQLDESVQAIMQTVKRTGVLVKGPIPLPKRIRKLTVLSSPHVDKDARDQFQIAKHGRVLIVYVSSVDTMSAIKQVELPPEVEVSIRIVAE